MRDIFIMLNDLTMLSKIENNNFYINTKRKNKNKNDNDDGQHQLYRENIVVYSLVLNGVSQWWLCVHGPLIG